jgi:hypothetical protein
MADIDRIKQCGSIVTTDNDSLLLEKPTRFRLHPAARISWNHSAADLKSGFADGGLAIVA